MGVKPALFTPSFFVKSYLKRSSKTKNGRVCFALTYLIKTRLGKVKVDFTLACIPNAYIDSFLRLNPSLDSRKMEIYWHSRAQNLCPKIDEVPTR